MGEAFLTGLEHSFLPFIEHGLGDSMATKNLSDRFLALEALVVV